MLKSQDSACPSATFQTVFPGCSLTMREPTPWLPKAGHPEISNTTQRGQSRPSSSTSEPVISFSWATSSSKYLPSTPELTTTTTTNQTHFLVLHSGACLSQCLASEAEVRSELEGGASELPGYRLLLSAQLPILLNCSIHWLHSKQYPWFLFN